MRTRCFRTCVAFLVLLLAATDARAQSLDWASVSPQTTATLGLVAMSRGNFDLSDQLYGKALSDFQVINRKDLIAICYAYYARAAVELCHPGAEGIVLKAVSTYKEAPTIDSALILKQLKLGMEEPLIDESTRRLAQWVYDAKTNSLFKRDGVTSIGAPPIVFTGSAPPKKVGHHGKKLGSE